METLFYEITLEESDSVSDFSYEENGIKCLFTLKCGKQKNGNFILSKIMYDKFSDKLSAIDFSNKSLLKESDLDLYHPFER